MFAWAVESNVSFMYKYRPSDWLVVGSICLSFVQDKALCLLVSLHLYVAA